MSDQPVPPSSVEKSPTQPQDDFARQSEEKQVGLLYEFGEFLIGSAAWWITPIVVVILLLGGLMLLTATGAGPFIYSMF